MKLATPFNIRSRGYKFKLMFNMQGMGILTVVLRCIDLKNHENFAIRINREN